MASLAGQEPGTGEGPVRQARKCSQVCFADSAVDWTLLVAGKVSPEPKGAGDVLHRRHRRRRWLPARIMLVSKESGHHGMNAFDHRTPSIPEEISEHPPVMVFGDASQRRGHLASGDTKNASGGFKGTPQLIRRVHRTG